MRRNEQALRAFCKNGANLTQIKVRANPPCSNEVAI